MYEKWVRLKCAYDRRDTGVTQTYAIEVNVELPAIAGYIQDFQFSGVRVESAKCSDIARLTALSAVFEQVQILHGTPSQLAESMQAYCNPPFYTLLATRDSEVVGGTVFRGHRLNNGERLIQIELIASKKDGPAGVGTSLMRVLRAFSQVSAAHTGHVAAFTLKTKNATRFYDRQLPEIGPGARALLYSVFLLDGGVGHLPKNLDMRSVVVRPTLA